jgi:HD-GYP domain-containing protein (c-di-GMP phosphodiesterase class II)
LGLSDLPVALRRYLPLVIAAGPLAAIVLALGDPAGVAATDPCRAGLLVLVAAAAERSTIHLTHKTAVGPVTAAHLALVLVCPLPAVGLAVFASGLVGQLLRRRRDPLEAAFNAGQGALAATAAALAYAALAGFGPRLAGIGPVGAVVAAAVVLHLANTGLVALAAAFHLGRPPARVFLVHLREGLAAHAALLVLGVTVAYLVLHAPLLVPTLAVPLWLVRLALRENVRLREDTHAALAALVEVVELRDPYTAGHSRRVAALAEALALGLGLTQEAADRIAAAGRVHDVGKVAIDPAVLSKPGKLTEEEFAEMRRHPVLGADVVARFGAYRDGVSLVRHHHEAWDGSGYPDGLAGAAIPLGARILAVVDTYDALTSDRPYRAGMDRARALAVLRDGAGGQWDPAVVAALLAHLGAEPSPSFASLAPAAAPLAA